MSDFDEAYQSLKLKMKWLPDVVFADVMNNLDNIHVNCNKQNRALNTFRILELDITSILNVIFWAYQHTFDPTLPKTETSPGQRRGISVLLKFEPK